MHVRLTKKMNKFVSFQVFKKRTGFFPTVVPTVGPLTPRTTTSQQNLGDNYFKRQKRKTEQTKKNKKVNNCHEC